jgi:hypothetical protein
MDPGDWQGRGGRLDVAGWVRVSSWSGRVAGWMWVSSWSGRLAGCRGMGSWVWATGRLQGDGIMGVGDWQAAGGWDHGSGRLAK